MKRKENRMTPVLKLLLIVLFGTAFLGTAGIFMNTKEETLSYSQAPVTGTESERESKEKEETKKAYTGYSNHYQRSGEIEDIIWKIIDQTK